MIDYIIVDDEPIAHRVIEGYCENLSHLNKKQNCFNVFEAIQFLNEESVDLIFLDINMPKLSGFEFLKSLNNPPKVIVTTAYKEFALEGYELNISDYLLKPFSFNRFLKAINKTINLNQTESNISTQEITTTDLSFFIKGDKKYHQIKSEQILFIEAHGNYTKIKLTNQTIVSHEKISNYENLLPKDKFLRVHKSFIVAISKINLVEGNKININNHIVPIGQTYKARVIELLKN
ncbi:LytR/AlgR family response regulator transcription factor [Winogradskyella sp. R77965]|uniref:LytR/AlgR family response regulator transcription factor n=1 Tax=Winogradskyella sp. R77965 TaxID=3093872 RepID=UPI0037DCFBA9